MFSSLPRGFPGGSDSKASACNAENMGSIPGSGRSPGEGNGNPLQHSYLENPHGRKSLIGYSPWGCKESDRTEPLHFHFQTGHWPEHQVHQSKSLPLSFFIKKKKRLPELTLPI